MFLCGVPCGPGIWNIINLALPLTSRATKYQDAQAYGHSLLMSGGTAVRQNSDEYQCVITDETPSTVLHAGILYPVRLDYLRGPRMHL